MGLKQCRTGRHEQAPLKPRRCRTDRAWLEAGAGESGYDTGLWTSARVAHLIEQECGIEYHPGHVWRILRQLGWSCQRPTGRALERDEAAIVRWKRRALARD